MILEILTPVARLVAATLVGFLLFKIGPIRRRLLDPVVFLVVNIVFPLYFVHSMPTQWSDGIAAGWGWMIVFFAVFFVAMAIQYGLAKLLVNRVPFLRSDHPQELIVLFAMHNAGYIPIPIIAALAPPAVSVYMSFYVMAFVLTFFTIAVWIIQGAAHTRVAAASAGSSAVTPEERPRVRFKLNAPIVGITVGLLLAVTGWYNKLPDWATIPFRWSSIIALDAIMVVLGAILASIPAKGLRFRREFGGLVAVRMVAFPAVVLLLMLVIPLRTLAPDVAAGIKLAMVLEAAVPPATNIIVITKAFGTEEQVEYAGGAIATTYAASVILLPLFLVVSRLLFG